MLVSLLGVMVELDNPFDETSVMVVVALIVMEIFLAVSNARSLINDDADTDAVSGIDNSGDEFTDVKHFNSAYAAIKDEIRERER